MGFHGPGGDPTKTGDGPQRSSLRGGSGRSTWLQMCEDHSLMVTSRPGPRLGLLSGPLTSRVAPSMTGCSRSARREADRVGAGAGRHGGSSDAGGFEAWHDSATSTSPSMSPRLWLRSSTTIWPTMPSTRRSSRCWPHFRSSRSTPWCRRTGTGTSTTSAPTALISSQPQMRAGTMHRVTFASRLVPLVESRIARSGALRPWRTCSWGSGPVSSPRCCGCAIP